MLCRLFANLNLVRDVGIEPTSSRLKAVTAPGGVTGARNLSRDLSSGRVVRDQVRQAKADLPMALLCPIKSMAPVLAIAGVVANAVPWPPL
jgi:hypothetical protein